jgi:dipeptidyl aminopeptidase/acylaminoacyl peptidase
MTRPIAMAVIGVLTAAGARAADPVTLETFGKLPAFEQVVISPDGARLAAVVTNGEQRTALVMNLPDMKPFIQIPASQSKLRAIGFAGPDHLIAEVSKTTSTVNLIGGRDEWYFGLDYDLERKSVHRMMDTSNTIVEGGAGAMNAIAGIDAYRSENGKPVIYVEGYVFQQDHGALSLFRYEPSGGHSEMTKLGDEHAHGWVVDGAGKALAESIYDPHAKTWSLAVARGAAMRVVKTVSADIERPSLMGLGRTADTVLIHTDDGAREWARDASDWSEPLMKSGDGPIFDPLTETLIGYYRLEGDADNYVFFNSTDQQMWNAAKGAYAGSRVTLISFSSDRKKWVLRVDSPTDGPAYAIIDFAAHSGKWIGFEYSAATDWVAPKQVITFKAADGLALTGYLTTPRGREAKNLPLIVFPHGGPEARDEPGFDWWAQAMASAGYAVLQVNYRGSDGFGWDFKKAGFGQYGRKMQTDLSDGVRYLAAQGKIDPKRVCIVGGSYGGYAALAGVTLDAGVYRCAVSVAGIADEKRMTKWDYYRGGGGGEAADRYWRRYIGADDDDDPRFDEISPIRHIDKVAAPVLLIHGKDDTVVPYEQSQIMFDALKKAGKTVEMVTLSHVRRHALRNAAGDHGLSGQV